MRVLILVLLLGLLVRAAAAGPGVGLGEALPEPVIASVARSTVAIHVDREPEKAEPIPRGPVSPALRAHLPPELKEYFRRPPGPVSGLLVDRKGHVLTTYYNVSGVLKSLQVEVQGGVRRPARLLSTDKSDDLALLEIEGPPAAELPEVKWADPAKLRVGRLVLAVGRSPDPARPTATFGIVSALGRNGGRAFQTDAELNYGNVGGPIADLDGEVLGLASFVGHTYPLWGLNSGIGFGTSTETIRSVLPTLLRGENVAPPERPFLGVGPAPDRGAVPGGGAPVHVDPGRPAAQAGVRDGDVVLALGGEKVEDFIELRRLINRHKPGDEVVLKVMRGGEELELRVRLGKRPE